MKQYFRIATSFMFGWVVVDGIRGSVNPATPYLFVVYALFACLVLIIQYRSGK